MSSWIAVLVLSLSCMYSYGFRGCAQNGMCSGLRQYGDNSCYYPGQLMEYKQKCITYICKKEGNWYMTNVYKMGCNFNGRCYQDQDEYLVRGGSGRCTYMKCRVNGRSWQMMPEERPC